MKYLLFLLLGWGDLGASPVWINRGDPVPAGLVRKGPIPMTGSMRPMIHGGEWCYVEYPPFKMPLKIGDLVGALTPCGPRLHEITALNERAVLTSGRANRQNDGWSLRSNVCYRVVFIERPEVSYTAQVK